MRISGSILSADFLHLERDICQMEEAGISVLHLDVMDGHHVPQVSFGLPLVKQIRKGFPHLFLDVHLMVTNPEQTALDYARAGAHGVTFHPETAYHSDRLIDALKKEGAKVGLALNPGMDIHVIEPLVHKMDLILMMSVNPGFSGQKWIPYTLEKVQKLKERFPSCYVQMDGGVSDQNIRGIRKAGVDSVVVGSYLFPDIKQSVEKLLAP
jgi:ribulose-phosphate 3-epimerase